MLTDKNPQLAAQAIRRSASPQPRAVRSHELLMGAREIHIDHGGELYRLTVTRQGKLILTK